MHKIEIGGDLQKILIKLSKKDNVLYEQLLKKIEEIANCQGIEHYKNLKYNMKESKRVHIGHFVLIFQYISSTDTIFFDDFDHHDNIYKN